MTPRQLEWRRPDDAKRYHQLVSEIAAHRCSVLVGAGLSIPAGYPSWTELIRDLANAAGIPFSEEAVASGGRGLLRLAGRCRTAMGVNNYHQFLQEVFHAAGKEPFRTIHLDLLEMPFNAFITTNFDLCLENAAERTGDIAQVHVYPILEASHLRSRHIYHIHGRAYGENGNSTVGTILLTESDYEEAYVSHLEIRTLLRDVFVHQTVLFIGFGLKDPALDQVLEASRKEYLSLNEATLRRDVGQLREKIHFALMPVIFKKEVDRLDGELIRDEEAERQEEVFLEDKGVWVVRYSGDDQFHSKLTNIVRSLRDRTAPPLRGRPSVDRSLFEEG